MGEDVGSRGGVFLATRGLVEEFGEERVIDTPLAEAAIAGIALGAAMQGRRPIAGLRDRLCTAFIYIVEVRM